MWQVWSGAELVGSCKVGQAKVRQVWQVRRVSLTLVSARFGSARQGRLGWVRPGNT